jgi:hypothetical protein
MNINSRPQFGCSGLKQWDLQIIIVWGAIELLRHGQRINACSRASRLFIFLEEKYVQVTGQGGASSSALLGHINTHKTN